MLLRVRGRWVSSLLGSLVASHSLGAELDPNAEKLLTRYEAFLDGMRTIRFDSTGTIHLKGGVFQDSTLLDIREATFARAGERWRLHEASIGYF